MVSIWAINGTKDSGEDDEIALGMPDEKEAKDLSHHVSKCALRYRMIAIRQKSQTRSMARMEMVLWVIALILLLSNPIAQKIFGLLAGMH